MLEFLKDLFSFDIPRHKGAVSEDTIELVTHSKVQRGVSEAIRTRETVEVELENQTVEISVE